MRLEYAVVVLVLAVLFALVLVGLTQPPAWQPSITALTPLPSR